MWCFNRHFDTFWHIIIHICMCFVQTVKAVGKDSVNTRRHRERLLKKKTEIMHHIYLIFFLQHHQLLLHVYLHWTRGRQHIISVMWCCTSVRTNNDFVRKCSSAAQPKSVSYMVLDVRFLFTSISRHFADRDNHNKIWNDATVNTLLRKTLT